MAIYDDNFQSYGLGAAVPFGSWILDTNAITNVIVAGGGPTGTTQSYRLFGDVAVDPVTSGTHASFTTYVAIKKLPNTKGTVLAFANGPNLSSHTFTLASIQVEQDATVSIVGPDADVIANSKDQWFEYNVVNFFQVNITLTDVPVGTATFVGLQCEVGLNGRQIMSVTHTSMTPTAQLINATSEVNRFQLISSDAFYSAYTLDSLQSMVTYPHPGAPKALAYQAMVEADVVPTTGKIRAIQAVAEADVVPTTAKLRVIQAVAECDVLTPVRWRTYEA